MRRCRAMGGMGLRRGLAVLLLVLALGLMALGLATDLRAALFVLTGAVLAAVLAVVDVDKLIGRG